MNFQISKERCLRLAKLGESYTIAAGTPSPREDTSSSTAMPHKTITPQQQAEYESLLHIHRINKTPMTPLQAVEACHKLSKHHTFIASEQTGLHVWTLDQKSYASNYSISAFDGMEQVGFYVNVTGFEELVQQVEALLHPITTLKDAEPDPDRFANDEERHEFKTLSRDEDE